MSCRSALIKSYWVLIGGKRKEWVGISALVGEEMGEQCYRLITSLLLGAGENSVGHC